MYPELPWESVVGTNEVTLEQWFRTGGDFAVIGDIFNCHNRRSQGCYWHLMRRGQGFCKISYYTMHRTSLHNKTSADSVHQLLQSKNLTFFRLHTYAFNPTSQCPGFAWLLRTLGMVPVAIHGVFLALYLLNDVRAAVSNPI